MADAAQQQDKKQAGFHTLLRFLPMLWPKGETELKARVIAAVVLVLAGKAAVLVMPFAYKAIIDRMSGPAVAFGVVAMLPTDDFMSWGWRIPFLLSALLFGIGLYIRSRVQESPAFVQAKREHPAARTGMIELFRNHRAPFVKALMLNGGPNVTGYLPAAFGLAYMTAALKFAPSVGVTIFAISNVFLLAVQPLAGMLADKVGGRRVFIGGALLGAASAYPFFWLLETGQPTLILIAYLLLFTLSGGIMLGAQASFLADQFPTEVRFSGVAISRELASGLVGGTLPLIATALTSAVDGTWMIGLLSVALMLIAVLGAYLSRGARRDNVPMA